MTDLDPGRAGKHHGIRYNSGVPTHLCPTEGGTLDHIRVVVIGWVSCRSVPQTKTTPTQPSPPVPNRRLHTRPHTRCCPGLRQLQLASCAGGLAQQVTGALLPPVHLLHLQQPEADLPRQLLAVTPAL
jgi:hypothetical protein